MTIADDRTRWLALYVLTLGSLMIVLDVTIVNVALPSIREDLGFSETSLAWVVNAYLLTYGGFLLLRGRLGRLTLIDDEPVHRARRPREGDGNLRLRGRRRRKHRRAARGRPDRLDQLALDLPRQRSDRRPRHRSLAAAAARRARSGDVRAGRRRRRRDRDRRADARRLRNREREPERLDVGRDARAARRSGRAAGDLPRDRVASSIAARTARPLQSAQHLGLQPRRCLLGRGDVRLVLPLGALPAARARVQPAGGRPVIPAREPDHGSVLDRALGEARDALRLQEAARDRAPAGRGRPPAVRARAGRRELPRRRPPEHDPARLRRRHRLQPRVARRDERRRAE